MQNKYDWIGKIEKHGVSVVLTGNNLGILELIIKKLDTDYRTFYNSMFMRYKGNTDMQSRIDDSRKKVIFVVKELEMVVTGHISDSKRVTNVFTTLDQVYSDIDAYMEFAESDSGFTENLNKTQESAGISLKQLKLASDVMKSSQASIKPRSALGEVFSSVAGSSQAKAIGGFGKQALRQALGPYALLGEVAVGGVKGTIDLVRGIKNNLARRKLTGDLAKMADLASPKNVEQYGKAQQSGANLGDVANVGGMSASAQSSAGKEYTYGQYSQEPGPSRESMFSSLGERASGGGKSIAFSGALFEFYDKLAYKAKYTKEVLAVLKGEHQEAKQGGGLNFGKMFSGLLPSIGKMIAGALPMILPALAVAGAAAAGAALGKYIGNLPAVKNALSGQNGLFTKGFELFQKNKPKDFSSDPVTIRALEIEKKNSKISTKAAVMEARKELGIKDDPTADLESPSVKKIPTAKTAAKSDQIIQANTDVKKSIDDLHKTMKAGAASKQTMISGSDGKDRAKLDTIIEALNRGGLVLTV